MKKIFIILSVTIAGFILWSNQNTIPDNIVFIGDSIMHSGKKYIIPNFNNSYFDTKIGRQFSALPEIVEKLNEEKKIKKVLVIGLGTNGPFKETNFDDVVIMNPNVDIFFINTAHRDRWEKEVNRKLEEKVSQYKNTHLIDFYTFMQGKKQYYEPDRTHLNVEGQKLYAEFVTDSIKKYYAEKGKIYY